MFLGVIFWKAEIFSSLFQEERLEMKKAQAVITDKVLVLRR